MKLTRCPICHCDIHLDALIEDDAGREVLVILSTKATHSTARHLVNYVGLFRSPKSNLNNTRTAKLMNEVLEQFQPSRHLAHALSETVESIRAKRIKGELRPLVNHNYLKSVYESTKQLFAYTESKEEIKPARSSNEEYFEQMLKMGADFNKLEKNIPGALIWYKQKTGANYD